MSRDPHEPDGSGAENEQFDGADQIEDIEPVDEVEGSAVGETIDEFTPDEMVPPDLPPDLPPALPFETQSPAPAVAAPLPVESAMQQAPVTTEELAAAKWYTLSFLIFSSIASIVGLGAMIYFSAKWFLEATK